MRLAGTEALVTGASSGIGRAIARALAHKGAHVLATGRDAGRLSVLSEDIGGRFLAADLADPDATRALAGRIQEVGVPALVVHCAGIGLAAPASQVSEQELRRVMEVNLLAPITLTGELLPAIRAHGAGRLVFVTSIAGRLEVAGESGYAASKAALGMYADSLRAELSGAGVGVTTFVPGVVDTEFFARRGEPYHRRFPRPMSAQRAADRLVDALERDRDEVLAPAWLRLPVLLRAVAPRTYRRLSRRWG